MYYGVGVTGVHVPCGVAVCEDIELGLVVVTCPDPGNTPPFGGRMPEAGN